jgi:hypothetical protein
MIERLPIVVVAILIRRSVPNRVQWMKPMARTQDEHRKAPRVFDKKRLEPSTERIFVISGSF